MTTEEHKTALDSSLAPAGPETKHISNTDHRKIYDVTLMIWKYLSPQVNVNVESFGDLQKLKGVFLCLCHFREIVFHQESMQCYLHLVLRKEVLGSHYRTPPPLGAGHTITRNHLISRPEELGQVTTNLYHNVNFNVILARVPEFTLSTCWWK